MYTNDKCDNWNVRVVGSDAKCVEYCEIDDKALREGNDCNNCRIPSKKEQTKLM